MGLASSRWLSRGHRDMYLQAEYIDQSWRSSVVDQNVECGGAGSLERCPRLQSRLHIPGCGNAHFTRGRIFDLNADIQVERGTGSDVLLHLGERSDPYAENHPVVLRSSGRLPDGNGSLYSNAVRNAGNRGGEMVGPAV